MSATVDALSTAEDGPRARRGRQPTPSRFLPAASLVAAAREELGPGARRIVRAAAVVMIAFHLVLSLTPDGSQPQRVELRFDRPLEDPELVWVAWTDTRFERFEVPPVGGERVLEAIDLQRAFTGK